MNPPSLQSKIIVGLATLNLAFALASCGGDPKSQSPDNPTEQPKEKPASTPLPPPNPTGPFLTDSRPEEALKAYQNGLAQNSSPDARESYVRNVAESSKVLLEIRNLAFKDLTELSKVNGLTLSYLAKNAAQSYVTSGRGTTEFQQKLQPDIDSKTVIPEWAKEAKSAFTDALVNAIVDKRRWDYGSLLKKLSATDEDYIPEVASLIQEALETHWARVEDSLSKQLNASNDPFPNEIYQIAARQNSRPFRSFLDNCVAEELKSYRRVIKTKALTRILAFSADPLSEPTYVMAITTEDETARAQSFDAINTLVINSPAIEQRARIEKVIRASNRHARYQQRPQLPAQFVSSLLTTAEKDDVSDENFQSIQSSLLEILLENSILFSPISESSETLSAAATQFSEKLKASPKVSTNLFSASSKWLNSLQEYQRSGFHEKFEPFMIPLMTLSAQIGNERPEVVKILGQILKDSPLNVAYAATAILRAVNLREGNPPELRQQAYDAVASVVQNASALPNELVNHAAQTLKEMTKLRP